MEINEIEKEIVRYHAMLQQEEGNNALSKDLQLLRSRVLSVLTEIESQLGLLGLKALFLLKDLH